MLAEETESTTCEAAPAGMKPPGTRTNRPSEMQLCPWATLIAPNSHRLSPPPARHVKTRSTSRQEGAASRAPSPAQPAAPPTSGAMVTCRPVQTADAGLRCLATETPIVPQPRRFLR